LLILITSNEVELIVFTSANLSPRYQQTKFLIQAFSSKNFESFLLMISSLVYFVSFDLIEASIFESFSLPQARSGLFSRFVCHPPLWLFGIGPGQNAQIDRQWSGQPQLSVLDQITVSKSGFQDTYGIADENGEIKPLSQTINMTFVELEPALRSSLVQSSTIVNRSTSFWTFGGAGQDIANIAGEIIR